MKNVPSAKAEERVPEGWQYIDERVISKVRIMVISNKQQSRWGEVIWATHFLVLIGRFFSHFGELTK